MFSSVATDFGSWTTEGSRVIEQTNYDGWTDGWMDNVFTEGSLPTSIQYMMN